MNGFLEHVSDALKRDLSLVLDDLTPRPIEAHALLAGKACDLSQAISHAAGLIRQAHAPAVVGMNHLSIEAARVMVLLAERAGCRLLWPDINPVQARQDVTMTASLGHAMGCEAVVWAGCDPAEASSSYPLARLFENARQISCPGTLETVLQLRQSGVQTLIGQAASAAVILPQSIDQRVHAQWHALAGAVQHQVRLAVIRVPWPTPGGMGGGGNARGCAEVVIWQTGLSPLAGGIDFGNGSLRVCSGPAGGGPITPDDADLVIDAGQPWRQVRDVRRITLGPADPAAAVSLILPGLSPGMAARVMRFDGTVLWLCDDPASAPADPAVAVIENLIEHLTEKPA